MREQREAIVSIYIYIYIYIKKLLDFLCIMPNLSLHYSHYFVSFLINHFLGECMPACWSLGVFIFKMFCGDNPFKTDEKIIVAPLARYEPLALSPAAKSFLTKD